jgi:hypothetical protein
LFFLLFFLRFFAPLEQAKVPLVKVGDVVTVLKRTKARSGPTKNTPLVGVVPLRAVMFVFQLSDLPSGPRAKVSRLMKSSSNPNPDPNPGRHMNSSSFLFSFSSLICFVVRLMFLLPRLPFFVVCGQTRNFFLVFFS